jgi:hypothetical protein
MSTKMSTREELVKLYDMYLRGLITFDQIVNIVCDEMTFEYLKYNNNIDNYFK